MSAPRVLFVDQSAEMGGAELSLLDIVTARKQASQVVVLADGVFRARLLENGVDVQFMPLGSAGTISRDSGFAAALSSIPKLLSLVFGLARRARAFDVIYANTQKAQVLAAMAAPLARRPLVFHLRDMLTTEHFGSGMLKVAVGLTNRFAACVIANSEATAQSFRDAGGTAPMVVVHNGIDPAAFDAVDGDAARQALRHEIGVPTAPLVGVFSRLAEWKGQHVLIDALKLLPEVHAVLVGGSLFEERAYEEALRTRVAQAGLADRVHFLGFRNDVPALMKGVDIVAHTSTAPEPFGRVIVEGMLSGRTVIGARAGGVLEIIEPEKTGLWFEPGDAQDLARCIDKLLAEPGVAQRIAQDGERAARERFSLQACLGNVERVIAKVVAGKAAA